MSWVVSLVWEIWLTFGHVLLSRGFRFGTPTAVEEKRSACSHQSQLNDMSWCTTCA